MASIAASGVLDIRPLDIIDTKFNSVLVAGLHLVIHPAEQLTQTTIPLSRQQLPSSNPNIGRRKCLQSSDTGQIPERITPSPFPPKKPHPSTYSRVPRYVSSSHKSLNFSPPPPPERRLKNDHPQTTFHLACPPPTLGPGEYKCFQPR